MYNIMALGCGTKYKIECLNTYCLSLKLNNAYDEDTLKVLLFEISKLVYDAYVTLYVKYLFFYFLIG